MKTTYLLSLILMSAFSAFSQESKYNETLAKSLNADDYGMKRYVFCLLKTGSNTTATADEKTQLLKGHMENIKRLAQAGKLVVAGPFLKNDKSYCGIFILNATTVDEAKELVGSDPAVKANLFEAELVPWYASAGLMQVNEIHNTIAKNKF